MPPCKTSRYMDSARARKNDGHMVWAAMFRQARIPIHAVPPANNTRHKQGKCLDASGRESHGGKEQDVEGDQPVDGETSAHPRQNGSARESAQAKESQQQAIAGRAVRTSENWQQRGQGTGGQAERSGADQDGSHLRGAPNIAQAGHQGIAHAAGRNVFEVRTLPAVQKKDHAEKRSRIEQERNSGAGCRDHQSAERRAEGAGHIEPDGIQGHRRGMIFRDRQPRA